jgi:hypothetical protein
LKTRTARNREAAGRSHGVVSVDEPASRAAVTRGARISSFFWIQSMIRDDGQRTLLFDLDMAIQRLAGESPDHPSAVQLTGIYHNLIRMWRSCNNGDRRDERSARTASRRSFWIRQITCGTG